MLHAASRDAPGAPGVYFFLGERTELLYVGKAGHLRKRLQQHALTKPIDGYLNPRYELVREVRWVVLDSEDDAAGLEADLIVALRPPFNAGGRLFDEPAQSHGGRWTYVVVTKHDVTRRHRFELTPRPREGAGSTYGCFPHLGRGVGFRPAVACSDGYVALLRMLWLASDAEGPVPRRISRSAPDSFETVVEPRFQRSLHALFTGVSAGLITELGGATQHRDAYLRSAVARDGSAALAFFDAGPRAIRRLRLRHKFPSRLVTREQFEAALTDEVEAAIGPFVVPARAQTGRSRDGELDGAYGSSAALMSGPEDP